MKIGMDLRALQTGHKFRGIGEVVKQVASRILDLSAKSGNKDTFVFFEFDGDDPKLLLTLPKGLDYAVVKLGRVPTEWHLSSGVDKLKRGLTWLLGNPVAGSDAVDVFLQFEYSFGVPNNTKAILIKYDLIPLIFWDKYFQSPWLQFRDNAFRAALEALLANFRYTQILERSVKNAALIVTVSESTKNDLVNLLHVKSNKIEVTRLGVDMKPSKTNEISDEARTPTKPYLLFVGAGDARRKVEDLVDAFNNLKAEGKDIQLVLVGENFRSPEQIPALGLRDAVMRSPYLDDIVTMGYVSDESKHKLFKGALAYVYPTLYEGFGIPILEGMLLGCPVIVFKNSSTAEVGGSHAIYTEGSKGIAEEAKKLMAEPADSRHKSIEAARKYAQGFTWDESAQKIYNSIYRLGERRRRIWFR